MFSIPKAFWSEDPGKILSSLQTSPQGLTGEDAERRLKEFGYNRLRPKKRSDPFSLFINQFKSPIILLLLFASILSIFLGDAVDSVIILIIVFISGSLGFWQEYSAANAVEALLDIVRVKAQVLRDGKERTCLSTISFPAIFWY